jgi:predicted transcriptional regulator
MSQDKYFPRGVRLDHEGLCRLLGHREACIMEVLWGRADVSVRDIYREVSKSEEIAYTTLMTITDRLWKKGLLTRVKKGKSYLYTPKGSRDSFMTTAVRRILDCFVPDMNQVSLNHFVQSLASKQPELLEELEKLIRERGSDSD